MQRTLLKNLEGETADNGYHIGVFGRQLAGDQHTSGSLIFAKNTHFLEGFDADSVYGQFNHEFLQLDADLGIRLLKLVRAEAIHARNWQ